MMPPRKSMIVCLLGGLFFALPPYADQPAVDADDSTSINSLAAIPAHSPIALSASSISLLSNKIVHAELDLSDDQLSAIRRKTVAMIEEQLSMTEMALAPSALFPRNLPKRGSFLSDAQKASNLLAHKQVEAELSQSQLVRLRQIQVQLFSFPCFAYPELQQLLRLSSSEADHLRSTVSRNIGHVNAVDLALRRNKSPSQEQQASAKVLRQERIATGMSECLEALTDEQHAQWVCLIGEKVSFSRSEIEWKLQIAP